MRTIKLILLALILIGVVVVALANRAPVTVQLLPGEMAALAPNAQVTLPLFLHGLIAILVGMVLGYLLEYLRETKHRRRASAHAREADRLHLEVSELRRTTNKPKDDVVALLGQ